MGRAVAEDASQLIIVVTTPMAFPLIVGIRAPCGRRRILVELRAGEGRPTLTRPPAPRARYSA